MIETVQEFKKVTLKYRYGFERFEKRNGHNQRGTQQTRRNNYFNYMKSKNVPEEVIEYSMNEFIPLDRAHMAQMRQNQLPSHLR